MFVYSPTGGDLVQIHAGMQEVGHSRGCWGVSLYNDIIDVYNIYLNIFYTTVIPFIGSHL